MSKKLAAVIFLLSWANVTSDANLIQSAESRYVTTTQGNSLDSIAARYVFVALQAWKLDPLPREMYGVFSRAPKNLEAEVERMPEPTNAGLRAEIRELQGLLAKATGSKSRRDWLSKHLTAVDTRLRLLAGERFALNEEARLLFDLQITPVSQEQLEASRAELDRLLPGKGTLNERLQAWINSSRIPDDKIEVAARLALAESRRRTRQTLKLPPEERVTLKFERGAPYGGWAEPRGGGHTVLHINLDRPITLGWLMHFIAHEGYPGHHVALALLEQTATEFPERRVLPPLSPSNTLLEGGADAVASVMWPHDETVKWLRRVLLPAIDMTHVDLTLLRRLQPHMEIVYAAALNIPFLLDQGTNKEEIYRFLEHNGLSDRRRAEALVADVQDSPFPASFALINAKHSPGSKALKAYLGVGPRALRRYVLLWTRPLAPSSLTQQKSNQ